MFNLKEKITREQLFNIIGEAFAEHQPGFPWPQKRKFAEQGDDFKQAFEVILGSINLELHEQEEEAAESRAKARAAQQETQEKRDTMFNDLLIRKDSQLELHRTREEDLKVSYGTMQTALMFTILLLIIVLFVSIVTITQMSGMSLCEMPIIESVPRCN